MQHNYLYMQNIYVNMKLYHVYKQLIYVYMQDKVHVDTKCCIKSNVITI